MGAWGISHWLVVLLVVALIFGTKKLGNMGSDLGKAVKGFKDGVKGAQETDSTQPMPPAAVADAHTVDAEVQEKNQG